MVDTAVRLAGGQCHSALDTRSLASRPGASRRGRPGLSVGCPRGRWVLGRCGVGPITSWTSGGDLASVTHSGDQSRLVLLIRDDLLFRYPGAAIYAAHAGGTPDSPVLDDTQFQLPLFRGQLLPDVTFVGFDLTEEQVRRDKTDAGWWFVIAQQPTEPRFRMEPTSFPAPALTSWNDLSWAHVAADAPSRQALAYAPTKPFPPGSAATLARPGPEGVTWGTGSGVQAHLKFRQPVRVAIHATDMLNPPAGG